TGKAHRGEYIFVRPRVEKLRLKDVARGADVLDRSNARRRSPVAAVARRTSRCAQIPLNRECFVVDARGIECELIDRNLVWLHVVLISVAMGAGLGNVHRIYGRL